jgi:hypothetical protein
MDDGVSSKARMRSRTRMVKVPICDGTTDNFVAELRDGTGVPRVSPMVVQIEATERKDDVTS